MAVDVTRTRTSEDRGLGTGRVVGVTGLDFAVMWRAADEVGTEAIVVSDNAGSIAGYRGVERELSSWYGLSYGDCKESNLD
jgi:hypothetical protein